MSDAPNILSYLKSTLQIFVLGLLYAGFGRALFLTRALIFRGFLK
jgi:hypothetical protein